MSIKNKKQNTNVNNSYPSILKLVEDGWNITDAVLKFGINTSTFYRKITGKQKAEIYAAKKLHTKYGAGHSAYYKKHS